jgi:hypothetical protein
MNVTADKIERLIFVKYLLGQSEHQKELERPVSSSAILTLHDLVECFLQLAYEHLTQKSKLNGNNILDTYSGEINKILLSKGESLINKAFIKRLNELRNQLKHATIFIGKKNIQNLHAETEIFLIDFTSIFFQISFAEITILNLLSSETIRNLLIDPEKQIKLSEHKNAIISIGKAFYEYEQMATEIKGKQGYSLVKTYHSRVDYTRVYRVSSGGNDLDSNLRRSLEDVAKDINEIKNDILTMRKVQLLNVDTRKYLAFKDIMPHVSKVQRHENNEFFYEYFIPQADKIDNSTYSVEQVKFCFDFVVDSIFNFQNKAYA